MSEAREAQDSIYGFVRRITAEAGIAATFHVELPRSRTARILRLRSELGELCVKLRRSGPFDSEAHWHEVAVAAGVPAPRMHAHGQHGPWSYAVYDWLQGQGGRDGGPPLGRALGEVVGRMHDQTVNGVGTWRSGSWEAPRWGPFIEENVQRFFKPRLQELADHGLSVSATERSLDTLIRQCHAAQVEPRLLHSDLGLDNVILRDGALVGLIDPGWCIGGDPLLDVSYFLLLGRNPSVRKAFEGSYPGLRVLDQDRLASYRMYHLLAKLIHWVDERDNGRAEVYAARLRELLPHS